MLKVLIALGGESVSVELLSEALWPDADGDKARSSFTTALARLRKLLIPEALVLQDARLTLAPDCCWVDADEFRGLVESAIARADAGDAAGAEDRLNRALGLYRGPFLDGEYDLVELLSLRDRLHEQFVHGVEKTAACHAQASSYDQAIAVCRRGLAVDDAVESFYRQLMTCCLRLGRIMEGIAAFERCRTVLMARYEVEPSEETRAAYQSLLEAPPAQARSTPVSQALAPAPAESAPDPTPAPKTESPANPLQADEAPAVLAPEVWRQDLQGECRTATAGFLDLHGYAEMNERLDPEEVEGIMSRIKDEGVRESTTPKGAGNPPSVAVMPWLGMGGEDTRYLCDGIAVDLVADLSKFSEISVLPHHATQHYLAEAIAPARVAEELGVRYVIDGSVRKSGGKLRVAAQVFDAQTNRVLWAERFDRKDADIFDVQDEISANVVTALDVSLFEGEQARVWRRSTRNHIAYEHYLRGRKKWIDTYDRHGAQQAQQYFEQALAADPSFSMANVALADVLLQTARLGWSPDYETALQQALALAENALQLDDALADAYVIRGRFRFKHRQFDEAVAEIERAIALSPRSSDLKAYLARIQVYMGEPALAEENIRRAKGLVPVYPNWYDRILGHACFWLNRYDEAEGLLRQTLAKAPDSIISHVFLTAVLAAAGRWDQLPAQKNAVLRIEPGFNLPRWATRALIYRHPEQLERMVSLLGEAGLPA